MFNEAGVKGGRVRQGTVVQTEMLQAQLLQQIQDLLVGAGYYRARLNIEPFDKILGGMCWCITGSNYDVDIEYEDDMNRGEKIKISEKVQIAIQEMECPHPLAAHQIQGLDYKKTLPVLQWLIETLKKSRDNRAILNRKQGLLSFNRAFKKKEGPTGEEIHDDRSVELGRMKNVIFNGVPKRIYKTNRNIDEVPITDPMRVHQALREYGDE